MTTATDELTTIDRLLGQPAIVYPQGPAETGYYIALRSVRWLTDADGVPWAFEYHERYGDPPKRGDRRVMILGPGVTFGYDE